MDPRTRIRRFTIVDRLFHLTLILTFMLLSVTGLGRLYATSEWGRALTDLFGGSTSALLVHKWAGNIMTVTFLVHLAYLILKVNWSDVVKSIVGPDSLVPVWRDVTEFFRRIGWFFGFGASPRFDRWSYWEKFDYWAVFWGLPLLAVTGFMLMYPIETSRWVPGWSLNVALLLHRAEAILAMGYIFTIHFFVGNFRRSTFPLNDSMFTGSMTMAHMSAEKPVWVERLQASGRLGQLVASPPAPLYRAAYFLFGYAVIGLGMYLLVNAILYLPYVRLH